MAFTIFFREAKRIFSADDFIRQQPIAHQTVLKAVADELAVKGTTTHPQAKKNLKGEWSLLLIDHGDAYVYTLFISTLERNEESNALKMEAPQRKGTLVIIDPSGPRDSIGGYHPGYWSVEQYADFLPENQRALFRQTVHQVLHNIPSENYSLNEDGSASIHIQRMEKMVAISLTCRAVWI